MTTARAADRARLRARLRHTMGANDASARRPWRRSPREAPSRTRGMAISATIPAFESAVVERLLCVA